MEVFGVRIHLSPHCCLVSLFGTWSNDHSIPRLTTKNVHFDSQPQKWTKRGLSRYGDCHLHWGPIRNSSDIPPNHWIDWLSRLFTVCFPTKWWTPDFWTTISNSSSFNMEGKNVPKKLPFTLIFLGKKHPKAVEMWHEAQTWRRRFAGHPLNHQELWISFLRPATFSKLIS